MAAIEPELQARLVPLDMVDESLPLPAAVHHLYGQHFQWVGQSQAPPPPPKADASAMRRALSSLAQGHAADLATFGSEHVLTWDT